MSGEKTEQPSAKKLRDARKKGQVAQSQDVHKLFITLAGFELIIAMKDSFLEKIQSAILLTIASINDPFKFALEEVSSRLLGITMSLSLLVLGGVIAARLVSGFVQYGFLIAPETLSPSLNKLDPVTNIKGMFSTKKFIELLTNIGKAVVVGIIFYIVIAGAIGSVLLASTGSLQLSIQIGVDIFTLAARLSLVFFGILAVIDYVVQKHFFTKQNMMTKDEVFREYKQSEGDPHMKGQRKALGRQIIESAPKPIKDVDNANAVVVNPTHFAVAVRYVPGETPLPEVLCKGVDDRARDIVSRAKQNDIPIIRYVWLARTLYSTGKEGQIIPKQVLHPMAAVYRTLNELKRSEEALEEGTILEIDHDKVVG